MSSATSTDPASFRPWHFFVLAGLTAATAAVFVTQNGRPANLILLSLTIGAAALTGMALYRTLAPLAQTDVDGPEMIGHRTRAALEREKMLVLRSIKELEFDRAMGKVADRDFEDMVGRLRARAINLMKQLDTDGSGYRELIERELQAKLAGMGVKRESGVGSRESREGYRGSGVGSREAGVGSRESGVGSPELRIAAVVVERSCEVCETINDRDARFCKQCGTPLGIGTNAE